MTSRFEAGQIVSYPYLWRWQSEEGRANAEKDRPVCLAIAIKDEDQDITHLIILPISGTPALAGRKCLEIPELELKRVGLSLSKQGWLSIDEYNYDVIERSYYFDTRQQPLGSFSSKFLKEILKAILPMLKAKTGRIDRTV